MKLMVNSNLRAFAVAGAVLVSAGTIAFAATKDDEAANKRIAPVARVEMSAPAAGAAAGSRSGEQIYKAVCGACHEAGVAGAPKLGDSAAWAPRIKTGLDGMMKVAIAGKNGMPPRGASDANDAELARTIVYMANKSGGSLKEPAAK
jgi:cytochrome c5